MAETSLINRIAIHATAESALPTLAAKGANIAKSAWTTATWDTIGSVERGDDDADLADDSIDWEIVDENEEIVQTRGMAIQDIIELQYYVRGFSFTCEDMGQDLAAMMSNISVTSNVGTFTSASARRAVAVEVNGLLLLSFPKCRVTLSGLSAGFGSGGKGMTTVNVTAIKPSTGEHCSILYYV